MIRKKLFWWALVVLAVVHTANVYALNRHLLINVSWIDIPFHLAGGVGVGLLALWYAELMRTTIKGQVPWWWWLEKVFFITAFFTLGWEVFEACFMYFPRQPFPPGYVADTIKDIGNGWLGAFAAYGAFYKVQWDIWRAGPTQRGSHSMAAPDQ
ncbi:hypothetical protein HY413_01500 [Candidatus Kaiserbacteria bacterium]|nr:hypothetical protein [Candidatus Kaiserbacteria bacterium]